LRWACWDASWHWVYRRIGKETRAWQHLDEWIRREHALKELSELPQQVLGKLLCAAWESAQHAALQRWPEGRRGLRSRILRLFRGRGDEDVGPHRDLFDQHFDDIRATGALSDAVWEDLKWMLWNVGWYVANRSKSYASEARLTLMRAERHLQRAFRGEAQWRGVNLGGWFILDPGTVGASLWESLPPAARGARCEWDLCEALGQDAWAVLRGHRRTFFCEADFEEIKAAGLSHVRLPLGVWCITGPREGEPYVGPCLEDLDRALDMIEGAGLRVILDLHGTVGGETAEASCGRENRHWHYKLWNASATLRALKVLAERYVGRECICGIGVCNEPSMTIPCRTLAAYYEMAVQVLRQAGMRAGDVAVLLPIHTELRLDEFLAIWDTNYPKYEDCVFDVHLYQCRGAYWSSKNLEAHLQAARSRARLIANMPTCCVSEWSLELPPDAQRSTDGEKGRGGLEAFARIQLEAFEKATHGWFYWTWKDSAGPTSWSLRKCLRKGVLTVPGGAGATRPP